MAQAWLDARKKDWAPETYRKSKYVVDTYPMPKLGKFSITTLSSEQATKVLGEIAADTTSRASKARQYVSRIVAYAIRKQLREEGKLLSLCGVVSTRSRGHIPAATDPKEVSAPLSKRTASKRSMASSVGSRNPLCDNSPT